MKIILQAASFHKGCKEYAGYATIVDAILNYYNFETKCCRGYTVYINKITIHTLYIKLEENCRIFTPAQ